MRILRPRTLPRDTPTCSSIARGRLHVLGRVPNHSRPFVILLHASSARAFAGSLERAGLNACRLPNRTISELLSHPDPRAQLESEQPPASWPGWLAKGRLNAHGICTSRGVCAFGLLSSIAV